MTFFKDSETRYQDAIRYLDKVAHSVAEKVRAKHKPADGSAISLGFGHGSMAGLSEDERTALRALLLCHVALNPTPNIRNELPKIRQFFTNQKMHIQEAIESFAVKPGARALNLLDAATVNYAEGSPSSTSWRGDQRADVGTCWNFVASCAFQAGLISLQKCIGDFFIPGAHGPERAARVLMNDTPVNTHDLNNIPPGFVVAFYRGPAGSSIGQLTHVTISTGRGSCKGVRQPTNPVGIIEDRIDAIVAAMGSRSKLGRPATEAIHVRFCDPTGMEDR